MKSVSVEIYCDEVKNALETAPNGGSIKWIYIGALIVRSDKKDIMLNELLNRRCLSSNEWLTCDRVCIHHNKNDKEIHYQDLRKADIYHLANRWADFFLADRELTSFYILGINQSRLNFRFFGESKGYKRFATIYNRFFRTVLSKPTKGFLSRFDYINIEKVYHDKSDLESHEKFPWHAIHLLDEGKMRFSTREIEFIDSDHRISRLHESNFIQYLDLLLGLTVNCFHASGRNEKTISLTNRIVPVIERLIQKPSNVNSSYRYVNRLAIDFFPKHYITTEENIVNAALRLDSFYKKRELRITSLGQGQLF